MALTPEPTRPSTGRVVWLDCLRGVAASAVVLGHYFEPELYFPVMAFLDPGIFGVGTFFFVSGYIIPASVRMDSRRPLTRFACARVFRLYPLYWLSLAIGIVVYGAGTAQVLVNITMAQRFFGVHDVIGAYWTLQVELLFYCFVATTIAAGKFNTPRIIAASALASAGLAVIFGAIRFLFYVRSPLSVPIGLALILVGNMFFLLREGMVTHEAFGNLCFRVCTLLLISFCLGYSRDWGYNENPGRFAISYGASAAVFFGMAYRGRCRSSVLRGLGLISYPLYLVHQPIQTIAGALLPGQAVWVVGSVALAALLLLAPLLHIAIERPAVRLGRRLIDDIGRRCPTT